MNITITFAKLKHLKWLTQKDNHVEERIMRKKITDQQILLSLLDGQIVGWLRFSLFWDNTPFINLLFVTKAYRHQQIGQSLVLFWEETMKKDKYNLVMTSSQSNENGQHFFRKIGYKDAGSLLLPSEPLEIIFIKELS